MSEKDFIVGELVYALVDSVEGASSFRLKGQRYKITASQYCSATGSQLVCIGFRMDPQYRKFRCPSCKGSHEGLGFSWVTSNKFARTMPKEEEEVLKGIVDKLKDEVA